MHCNGVPGLPHIATLDAALHIFTQGGTITGKGKHMQPEGKPGVPFGRFPPSDLPNTATACPRTTSKISQEPIRRYVSCSMSRRNTKTTLKQCKQPENTAKRYPYQRKWLVACRIEVISHMAWAGSFAGRRICRGWTKDPQHSRDRLCVPSASRPAFSTHAPYSTGPQPWASEIPDSLSRSSY